MCVKLYVFIHRRKVNVRFVNQHTLIYVHSRKVFVYVIVRPHALMVYKKKKTKQKSAKQNNENDDDDNKTEKGILLGKLLHLSHIHKFCYTRCQIFL